MVSELRPLPEPSVLRRLDTGVKKRYVQAPDLIEILANTVDDVSEALIGGRPAERLLKILAHISPAATWERVTGLPAPGEVLDRALDKLTTKIEQTERRIFPGISKAKRLEQDILKA